MGDAEKYKAEDEEKRKCIVAKNDLESVAYSIRNSLSDDSKQTANICANVKQKMNALIAETISWIDANPNAEREEYEAKKEELEEVWRPIISASYGQQQPQQPANDGDSSGPKIDEVDRLFFLFFLILCSNHLCDNG